VADDIKPAAQAVRTFARNRLGIPALAAPRFESSILAHLITFDMQLYRERETSIFEGVASA